VVVVLKVAVTDSAALIVIAQVPVPLHPAPLHPANAEPVPAAAVSVTTVPSLKFALHVVPQLIPAGELVTVPVPVPAFVTVNPNSGAKLAVTASAAFIVTTQVPVPLHPAPLHPVNADPLAGAAVNVTDAPPLKFAEHVEGHVIPAGLLVTVPSFGTLCTIVTESGNCAGVNVAVTDSAAFMSIVQGPVPLHSTLPVQPVNVLPLFGVAVSVTTAPPLKFAEHVLGQRIPDGLLDTVPLPVPASVTVSPKVDVAVNVVTMVDAEVTVTKQLGLLPTQPWPSQLVKVLPVPGASLSVSCVPCGKLAVQVPGQLIPAGLLVTVPVPVPDSSIVTEYVAAAVYVTVTVCAALITVVHGCVVPKQPPPVQPVKVDPAAGAEYKLITAPLKKVPEHEPPTPAGANVQLIPSAGAVTVPLPVMPAAGWRLNAYWAVPLLNVAVTVVFAVSVNAHVFPVEHPPPPHEPKTEPLLGVSASVICVPLGNVAEHVPVTTPSVSLQFVVETPATVPYAGPLSTTFNVRFVVGTKVAVAD
jgi:hypothetical protein